MAAAVLSGLGIWGLLAACLLTAIALHPAVHGVGPAVDELLSGIYGTPRHAAQPVGVGSSGVPDMRGTGVLHAQSVLTAAGFNSEVRMAQNATELEPGQGDRWIVCETNPPAGTRSLRGTVITLVVSDRGCG